MSKKLLGGFALLFFFPIYLHSQAISPVTPKRANLSVGGMFSIGQSDYGQNSHLLGPGAYGDFDYIVWRNFGIGVEGEARFRDFNTISGVYEQNYLGGPRLTWHYSPRLVPYVKFLAGGTRFHYPNFISNQVFTYTTIAVGGGIDLHLHNRWTIRPADFEYQHLDFPPTGLTPWTYSAGVSYRLF